MALSSPTRILCFALALSAASLSLSFALLPTTSPSLDIPLRIWKLMINTSSSSKTGSPTSRKLMKPLKRSCVGSNCWAFSTVAAMEGINKIVTGNLKTLSEQELIDCGTTFNGGLMDYAFEYIVKNGGLRKEENYPYSMEEGTCETQKDDSEMVNISGHQNVPRNDDKSLLKALAHQPLSIAIDASGREFQFYKGGVFDGRCGVDLDRAG
ncbi:unnamed protein product [Brassica oleracea]